MRVLVGEVVSTKMAKTAIVAVKEIKIHPLYEKRRTVFKKFPVHDEIGVKVGEWVEFRSGRPIAKTKKWVIVRVLGKPKTKK